MKAPVTLSGCAAFVVHDATVSVPKSPRFHTSIPAKTETVSVQGQVTRHLNFGFSRPSPLPGSHKQKYFAQKKLSARQLTFNDTNASTTRRRIAGAGIYPELPASICLRYVNNKMIQASCGEVGSHILFS